MDTIYIVTTGEYSSFGNSGVFSSREKAEEYRETFRHPKHGYLCDHPAIEEWPVDAWFSTRDKTYWTVEVCEEGPDAGITKAWSYTVGPDHAPTAEPQVERRPPWTTIIVPTNTLIPDRDEVRVPQVAWRVIAVCADTEKAAIKIAMEHIMMAKAQAAGVG